MVSKIVGSAQKVSVVPALVRRADLLQRCGRLLVGVGLEPLEPVAPDAQLEPGRQGVDDRDADAVQAAGDGVGLAVEFPAGVQHGEDDLGGRPLLGRVHVDREATAVVTHPHAAVGEQGDLDAVGVTGQRLVDGVVDDLLYQVVQAALGGRADVHAGTLADGLESLEDGDGTAGVGVLLAPRGGFTVGRGPWWAPVRRWLRKQSRAARPFRHRCRSCPRSAAATG